MKRIKSTLTLLALVGCCTLVMYGAHAQNALGNSSANTANTAPAFSFTYGTIPTVVELLGDKDLELKVVENQKAGFDGWSHIAVRYEVKTAQSISIAAFKQLYFGAKPLKAALRVPDGMPTTLEFVCPFAEQQPEQYLRAALQENGLELVSLVKSYYTHL